MIIDRFTDGVNIHDLSPTKYTTRSHDGQYNYNHGQLITFLKVIQTINLYDIEM